ncbi:MAG: biotin/lipoyl-binding protein, partial [Caulobacteraceae bacterium]
MPDSSPTAPSAAIEAKPEPPPAPAPAKKPSGRRRILFIGLGAVLVLAAVAWGAWWLLVGSRHVTTDNAYVSADVAEITPMVAGPITGVTVIDTQPVVAGQVLATIDAADYQVALDQARAQLGQAQRRVQGYYANEQAL